MELVSLVVGAYVGSTMVVVVVGSPYVGSADEEEEAPYVGSTVEDEAEVVIGKVVPSLA